MMKIFAAIIIIGSTAWSWLFWGRLYHIPMAYVHISLAWISAICIFSTTNKWVAGTVIVITGLIPAAALVITTPYYFHFLGIGGAFVALLLHMLATEIEYNPNVGPQDPD